VLIITVAARGFHKQREGIFQTGHSRRITISVFPEDSRVVVYSSVAGRSAGWTLQDVLEIPDVSCHTMDLILRNTPSGVFRAGHFSHLTVHNRLC
jgi:hypothetical protein